MLLLSSSNTEVEETRTVMPDGHYATLSLLYLDLKAALSITEKRHVPNSSVCNEKSQALELNFVLGYKYE